MKPSVERSYLSECQLQTFLIPGFPGPDLIKIKKSTCDVRNTRHSLSPARCLLTRLTRSATNSNNCQSTIITVSSILLLDYQQRDLRNHTKSTDYAIRIEDEQWPWVPEIERMSGTNANTHRPTKTDGHLVQISSANWS